MTPTGPAPTHRPAVPSAAPGSAVPEEAAAPGHAVLDDAAVPGHGVLDDAAVPGGDGAARPDAQAAAVSEALRAHLGEYLSQVEQIVAGAGRRIRRPGWRHQTPGEARWPVAFAVLVAIGLQLVIPERLAPRPLWLLPGLELALLALLIAANPRRIEHDHRWIRAASLALVALASVANAWSAVQLVRGLVASQEGDNAGQLLTVGGAIWLTNVIIFALWYWEFDRGGPVARSKGTHVYPDFQFPQMQTPELTQEQWEPTFVDYLYLSFTNAMAFSPTDTLPLSRWAKMLMLSQSLVSLATVVLVIARAVNILR